MHNATLRIARPTHDIARLVPFYCGGLGYQIVGSFDNHNGFDGIMFGLPGAAYHLEFTRHQADTPIAAPHPEDLLVLYLPDENHWQAAVERMEAAGFESVRSANPYWQNSGRTFEDPDGHRIVFANVAWPPPP